MESFPDVSFDGLSLLVRKILELNPEDLVIRTGSVLDGTLYLKRFESRYPENHLYRSGNIHICEFVRYDNSNTGDTYIFCEEQLNKVVSD